MWPRRFASLLTGLWLACPASAQSDGETSYSVVGKTLVEVVPPTAAPAPVAVPEEPKVVLSSTKIRPLEPVFFRSGGAEVLAESLPVLDAVAEVLATHPAITLVRVEAHTDAVAGDNGGLSERRARWVRAYLIRKGVAPQRLSAKGYGSKRPIASNLTREGRSANRRVEFVIAAQRR